MRIGRALAAALFLFFAGACRREGPQGGAIITSAKGEVLFSANCARCHGSEGTGTAQGPPLVHRIYEPNHHGDAAFHLAAANGVRAHHWGFGDMPPYPALSREDVQEIVIYIRAKQRRAGIG